MGRLVSGADAGPFGPLASCARCLIRPEYGPILTQIHVPPQDLDAVPEMLREWDFAPFSHMRELRLRRTVADPSFCFQARGGRIADLLYLNHYSDTFTGISGRGPGDDPAIVHFVSSGYLRFEGTRGGAYMARPGQVVFKDTSKPWRVWSGPGTRARVLIVPRNHFSTIRANRSKVPEIAISDASVAEARLLAGFLDLAPRFDHESFSHLGRNAGQEAGIQLVSALIGEAKFDEPAVHSTVTLHAARLFIDAHLTDPELSPAMVALNLHISIRTLHRAFGSVDDSVMAYVRRQRLRGAKAALAVPGARVVEVAAWWQFSNSSHFIRNFKAAYGITPASYIKEVHASDRWALP